MHSYFRTVASSTEQASNKYIKLNNCGFYDSFSNMETIRKNGRIDYQLIYVKSGELTIHQTECDLVLRDGDIYLFRPRVPQIYGIHGTPTTFFWIHFTGTGVEEMLSFFEKNHYNVGSFNEFENYCSSNYDEYISSKKYKSMLREGDLISLFARLAAKISGDKKMKTDRTLILPALNVMNSPSSSRLSNEELAKLCSLNKYYFIKIFKSSTGYTPQQYYIGAIIDKSKHLLESTTYNVNEISHICGIDDVLYFSRIFKKHTGLSPLNYRKQFFE